MRFFLKPENGPDILFTVLDSESRPVYEVTGRYSASIGCRFRLCGLLSSQAANMTGVNLPSSIRYSVSAGGKRMRITVKPNAVHHAVSFKGVRWRFRGNILTRSFDIIEDQTDGQSRLVMTHGQFWNGRGDCYAVEIPLEADIPMALCTAVAVDCTVIGGCAAPVAAG